MLARALAAAAAVLVFATVPSAATAQTYCVTPLSGCAVAESTVAQALSDAGTHPGADTVELGPRTYSEDAMTYTGADPVTIEGAGRSQTMLARASAPSSADTLDLESTAPVTMRHLDVRAAGGSGDTAIFANSPLVADDLSIDAAPSATGPDGILAAAGLTLTGSTIALVSNGDCVNGAASAVDISASSLSGCAAALSQQGGTAVVHSSLLTGNVTAVGAGAGANVKVQDSILRTSLTPGFGAISAIATGGTSTTVLLRDDTILLPGGTALSALTGSTGTSFATVLLSDSIMRGAAKDYDREAPAGKAGIIVDDSDVSAGSSANTDTGAGAIGTTAVIDVDPGFVSPVDLHLSAGSPVLDLDPRVLFADEPADDFDGLPRIIGGARDYGAYERPRAPAPSALTSSAVDTESATLSGTVDPGGLATTAHVDVGTTPAYGQRVDLAPVDASGTPQTVQATLTGLSPDTTYYARLEGTNGSGTADGPLVTFHTPAPPAPPAPVTTTTTATVTSTETTTVTTPAPAPAPTPTPATTSTSPAPPPLTPASLSGITVTPKRQRVGKPGAVHFTVIGGPGVKFPTVVTVTISQTAGGHRVGAACSLTATHGRPCATSFSFSEEHIFGAGPGQMTLPARPGGRKLVAGHYSLSISTTGGTPQKRTITLHR